MKEKGNILIADDEKSILIAYRQLFKSYFDRIDIADNINDAIDLIGKSEYKLIITDLEFGGKKQKEGLGIIRAARESSIDVLIIVITAYGNISVKNEVYDLGADYYFEKPVQVDSIKKVLINNGIITGLEQVFKIRNQE